MTPPSQIGTHKAHFNRRTFFVSSCILAGAAVASGYLMHLIDLSATNLPSSGTTSNLREHVRAGVSFSKMAHCRLRASTFLIKIRRVNPEEFASTLVEASTRDFSERNVISLFGWPMSHTEIGLILR
jgi:hypothetical protein